MSHLLVDSWLRACLLGTMLSVVAGCGGPPAPKRTYAEVAGKVTYKGEPVKMGKILFQPASGVASSGELSSEGTYSLKGEIGQNTVMIISREEETEDPKKQKQIKAPKSFIPANYGTPASGLNFDVKAGTNKADWDLK